MEQGRLVPDTLAAALRPALNTDRWFYGVFQSAPDLIRWLAASPDGTGPGGVVPTELDRQYRFSAPELKAGSHRLDGVLWPLGSSYSQAYSIRDSIRWALRCRIRPKLVRQSSGSAS